MEPEKKHTTDLSINNQDNLMLFEKDADFVFVHKKTEKLASAVYMVTNLFSENEPIKWMLRKKSGELMSFILNYKDVSESNYADFVNSVKTRVLDLVSLLEISLKGGLISTMNFSILNREFLNLVETLNSPHSSPKEPIQEAIPKNFFQASGFGSNPALKDNPRIMSFNPAKDTNYPTSREQFKRSNRQNIILGLLKKKKELTIKDISEVIKDCSEKTIQRELISFISAGVLKRTGERRWSKYSLV